MIGTCWHRFIGILAVVHTGVLFGLAASQHSGTVVSGGVPVPGATVILTQGDRTIRTITDEHGVYSFADLSDGVWATQIEMLGFASIRDVLTVPSNSAPAWELSMLPVSQMKTEISRGFPPSPPVLRAPQTPTAQGLNSSLQDTSSPPNNGTPFPNNPTEADSRAADRLLINGSVNNGAASVFAQSAAFGNFRPGQRSLYTGNVVISGNNSTFDARSYSLTGQNTPRPAYNRLQSSITLGGPLQVPHVFRMGQFTFTYSRTQNRNVSLETAQIPTLAERAGDFSASSRPPIDPTTGAPFPDGVIPENRISLQARALASLYPSPNFSGAGRYNYQIPIAGVTHADNIQGTISNIRIGRADQLSISGSLQSTRSDDANLFSFTNTTDTSATSAVVNWTHRFNPRISGAVRYQFSRTVTEVTPHFANHQDVSGDAGISGSDRDPRNWGPPALNFAGGIARLSSGSYAFDRSQWSSVGYSGTWIRGRHNLSYGSDYRRQQFNLLSQRDARGAFTFTGASTGIDVADFLLGIPTASSIAFGNADKYFRQSLTSAYVTDDFRWKGAVTFNLGVRWEYESPIREKYGRLVNLDIAPGFVSVTPVIAGTSRNSLLQPDKGGIQPRVGLAWRPRGASSLVVRAGYGVYRDANVYRAIADDMAQQSPLSKSLSVGNSADNALTLADGFRGSPFVTATTFAVDSQFRVGYAQNWNLSIQGDLPAAMQMTVTYLGIKGTHVPQRILPNTFPAGVVNPCRNCPAGFIYLTSNGNTNRHAGTFEVRRRQRNGFEASARYTFAKAIDDAGLGGSSIAQNWLDVRAERALSNSDQRHQLVIQALYTPGMLAGTGTFWDGWRGKVFKSWTLTGQLTLGSGSPLTPIFLAPVTGTGVTGSLRPDITGAPLYSAASGGFLNVAAYAAPTSGTWGNAGRNSITGPGQFSLNASLARTFRVNDRVSVDLRVDSMNVLNHVTFPSWNTIMNSAQFGLPTRANAMRTVQPSIRMRF